MPQEIDSISKISNGKKKKCSRCQGQTENRGLKNKVLLTIFGEIKVRRALYRCKQCGHLMYPVDSILKISRSMVSKRFAKISSMIMIFTPFEHTKKIIKESLQIDVSETCLKKISYRIGTKLYKDAEKKGRMPYSVEKDRSPSEVLYIHADGAMVPI